jgi:hypothetical protein
VIDGATQEDVKILLRGFMDGWIAKQYEELGSIGRDGSSPGGILAPFPAALVPGIRGMGEGVLDRARESPREDRARRRDEHARARRQGS